jgi:Mn-dependent DtxR family transcriptional regulator
MFDLWMYEKFKLMSFQDRMEAILSGILSPDLKGITLQAMRRGVAYTKSMLYREVCDFIGVNVLPVNESTPWEYCHGYPSKNVMGPLKAIGVIEERILQKNVLTNPDYVTAYEKNDAGFDLGDPSVALGTYIVNKLYKKGGMKYFSLWRILGLPGRPGNMRFRGSYTVYRLVEFLAKNYGDIFRRADIEEELTELHRSSISDTLNKLGEIGVIDYESASRGSGDGWTRGWARYRLTVNRIDFGEVREMVMKESKRFYRWGALRRIIDYINQNPMEEFTCGKLASKLGMYKRTCSTCLSLLSSMGYLSYDFKGGEVLSKARANENTLILYEEFFEPIARMCRNLDPDAQGLRDKLEYYLDHRDLWREHLRTQVYLYDGERSHVGPVGGGEIRNLILEVLKNGESKKLKRIFEEVNESSPRKLAKETIRNHLKILVKKGLVERVRDGWYRRVS